MDPELQRPVNDFLAQIGGDGQFAALFEYLPDVCFFVIDRELRIMMVNAASVALLRQPSPATVLGKTAAAFFPPGIAKAFHDDDRRVLEKKTSLIERLELMLEENGQIAWYCTSKFPLYAKDGTLLGIMGITRRLEDADPKLNPLGQMMPIVDYICRNLQHPIAVDELARRCHLSPSQFRRRFKSRFHESPMQFIMKLRVQKACQLLTETGTSIREVGERSGFPDQNNFARQFRRLIGVNPRTYRKDWGS